MTRLDNSAWQHTLAVTRPMLALSNPGYLDQIAAVLRRAGVQSAVARHDTPAIFDWLIGLVSLQGISDRVAFAWDAKHGGITWAEIEGGLKRSPSCPKLRCHWSFEGCGYRKGLGTCAEPTHILRCPLPQHRLRKGGLNRAAYALHLFLRDVCNGDLVAWLNMRLAEADATRPAVKVAGDLQTAVLEPLTHIHGIGAKLWSMMLADLLLAGDPGRPRWVEVGAGFIAIDTLVHNFLHRTGALRRHRAVHSYGAGCYAPGGCADIIAGLARRFDATTINPTFPTCFPRLVQHAIWNFCATSQQNICNGVQIDDRRRCRDVRCPAFPECDRCRLG
ncbi:hypothetical protein [Lichenifustis flavocetrariae]|uniref:Uncharacterized protein n=1 Tax=Lichenifustis flavocetrariae TaxID=2949735 RepID=A0AA41Z543_9HYPH|nr:hypothetical protein [Lichenifustis flavocetrariae]MCW6513123.1 hypothetical protein [Lichenifustis flavocetrariae]